MKILIKTAVLIGLSSFILTACQKSDMTDLAPTPTKQATSIKDLVSNPQFIRSYQEMEARFNAQEQRSGAEFIAPFFTADGFGIGQNLVVDTISEPGWGIVTEGQFAMFFTELGPRDLYRTNPDGTVTVNINSKIAQASHYDIVSNVEHTGTNAKLNMSYTGPVVSFDITDENGEVIFTVNYIDWFSENRGAVSFHGNGKVRQGNTGAFSTLISRLVATPGWGQVNQGFNLN